MIVREEERGYAAAAHLLAIFPLWGVVFLAGLWIYFKERSREVVFHVQQALMFQMIFLGVAVFAIAVNLLLMPVAILNQRLADFLKDANSFFLVSCFVVYMCVCLVGMVMTLMGRPFLYPVVGRRMMGEGRMKEE